MVIQACRAKGFRRFPVKFSSWVLISTVLFSLKNLTSKDRIFCPDCSFEWMNCLCNLWCESMVWLFGLLISDFVLMLGKRGIRRFTV